MDVFSLGAIAYHIFAGKPPAETPSERVQLLHEKQGFVLSSELDGVAPELEELIHESTRGEVLLRTESVADFLKGLDAYEEKLYSRDFAIANLSCPRTGSPLFAHRKQVHKELANTYLKAQELTHIPWKHQGKCPISAEFRPRGWKRPQPS